MTVTMYPALIALTVGGILFFPFGFLIWKVSTGWDGARIMRHFIWLYGKAWISLMSPFVRFTREASKATHLDEPCIIVVNHLSFFDTYCMGLLPFSNVAFAVRSWPFKMFWYAPFMRLAGYLDLETIGWEGTLRMSRAILEKGGKILFFPEGHRSRDGRMQRFYSGPFKLAVETNTPILPVCLAGTDVLLPPDRWWLKPATVRLKILPIVSPKDFTGETAHVELRKTVKERMMEQIDLMRKGIGTA